MINVVKYFILFIFLMAVLASNGVLAGVGPSVCRAPNRCFYPTVTASISSVEPVERCSGCGVGLNFNSQSMRRAECGHLFHQSCIEVQVRSCQSEKQDLICPIDQRVLCHFEMLEFARDEFKI